MTLKLLLTDIYRLQTDADVDLDKANLYLEGCCAIPLKTSSRETMSILDAIVAHNCRVLHLIDLTELIFGFEPIRDQDGTLATAHDL